MGGNDLRILIHVINFSPEAIGIGKFTGEMAEWLAARGHAVRVVTAPPFYPGWRIAAGFSGMKFTCERVFPRALDTLSDGACGEMTIFRCPIWVPANPSAIKRILHSISFSLCSLPVMLMQAFWRPDVVLVIEPSLVCAPQAWFVARLCGARSWLHVQDLEVDAAFEMGLLPAGPLSRFAYAMERVIVGRFDRVSTISPNMLSRMLNKGARKGVLFPNWVNTEKIFPMSRVSEMRKAIGLSENAVVALYSGNMSKKQGLEILIEVARLTVSDPSIQFVLCGDGPAKSRLQMLGRSLKNVLFLPLQPLEKLNCLLNLADLHLMPQVGEAADLVMPSKLTGMLASGRPVVATAALGTQIASVVAGCGIVVTPGNPLEFASAVRKLAANSGLRKSLGAAAREYALANMSLNTILAEFESALFSVVRYRP